MPRTIELVQVTLQALTSFAIAGGLLYTAVQFRQAQKAQLVANFSKLVELQFGLRQMRVLNPALVSEHERESDKLRTDHDIQQYYVNLMQLSLFEIAWYAHKHGQLPADYFDSWTKRMRQLGGEPAFRNMLNNPAMKILHDDFDSYVRALVLDPPRA